MQAHALHRARRVQTGAVPPHPLTPAGTAYLVACHASPSPAPYVADATTVADPLRRPFLRLLALEDAQGEGARVEGLRDGQAVQAYMESKEAKDLSESATRSAYDVVSLIAANLPGGCHMFRVGDGAHAPHPRSKSIGLATAWAVFRGPL